MAASITRDPREYRRGMVLGLTLAESLLLLLFLLLLAMAAVLGRREEAVQQAQAQFDQLRPLIETYRRAGTTSETVEDLAARLRRGEASVAEVERLRPLLEAAQQQARIAEQRRAEAEQAAARLERGAADQRHAQAQLQRQLAEERRRLQHAEEVAARFQGDAALGREVAPRLAEADRRVQEADAGRQSAERGMAAMRDQLVGIEADRDRVIADRMIAHGIYPSCWHRDGQPEFVFQIALLTHGRVIVEDRAAPARRSEQPWRLLQPFPRGVPIDVGAFVNATREMAAWSQRQSPPCRFWISVRREMGPDVPNSEYLRVISPLGNAVNRWLPFYRFGG
jgi:hypothetical protein